MHPLATGRTSVFTLRRLSTAEHACCQGPLVLRPELAAEPLLQIALCRARARDPVERRPHVELVAEEGGMVGAEAHVKHVLLRALARCVHL